MVLPLVSALIAGVLCMLVPHLDKEVQELFEYDRTAQRYPSTEPPPDPNWQAKETIMRGLVYSLPAGGLIGSHLLMQGSHRPERLANGHRHHYSDRDELLNDAEVEAAWRLAPSAPSSRPDMAPLKPLKDLGLSARHAAFVWQIAQVAAWAFLGGSLLRSLAQRRRRAVPRQEKLVVSSLPATPNKAALEDVEAGHGEELKEELKAQLEALDETEVKSQLEVLHEQWQDAIASSQVYAPSPATKKVAAKVAEAAAQINEKELLQVQFQDAHFIRVSTPQLSGLRIPEEEEAGEAGGVQAVLGSPPKHKPGTKGGLLKSPMKQVLPFQDDVEVGTKPSAHLKKLPTPSRTPAKGPMEWPNTPLAALTPPSMSPTTLPTFSPFSTAGASPATHIDIAAGEYDIEGEYDEERWRFASDAWLQVRRESEPRRERQPRSSIESVDSRASAAESSVSISSSAFGASASSSSSPNLGSPDTSMGA